MPELQAWQWCLGGACAFLAGVAKTGVPGLGILIVPLIVLLAGDARVAAGWLLPILCTADLFAVYYWRLHAAAGRLFSLAPWVVAGMAAGGFALALNERVLRPIVGGIVLLMLAVFLYRRHTRGAATISAHPAPYGFAAGFATTVANAAGPVMNIYLLSKRLQKEEFVATGAWFFFVINLAKLPIYAYHDLFTRESLAFNALMIPAVAAGAVTGRWLITRTPDKLFEVLVVALTVVSTAFLFR
jgi:uncharacterized membrane protein YfcA